jgi:hypothetical protein
VLVATLGLILKVMVSQANVAEREGAAWLLLAMVGLFTRWQLIWVDGGYAGVEFAAWVKRWIGVRLEVVERDPDKKASRNYRVAGWSSAPWLGSPTPDG